MCGIAGSTVKLSNLQRRDLSAMLTHRGPDARGQYVSQNGKVSLLHTRLSILDIDSRSNQPMWDSAGRYCIVYNGEIFNFKALRKELSKKYTFRTTSDTEVILNGFIEYKHQLWEKLSGMYALCIYDTKTGKLICARDHAGIKPLYYHYDGKGFSFSSELKSLMRMVQQTSMDTNVDTGVLQLYFNLGYVPSPFTLYKNVQVLEKSSYLEYDLTTNELFVQKYRPRKEEVNSIKDLQQLLEYSVGQHLASDVPVGLFFSGGTDSALIAAILRKLDSDLQAFTVEIPEREIDSKSSEAIANHLGVKAQRFTFGQKEFNDAYSKVKKYIGIPIADVSLFPTQFISEQAARSVKVVLSGEGGDELFFGYPRHLQLRAAKERSKYVSNLLTQLYARSPSFRGKGLLYQKVLSVIDPAGFYVATRSPAGDCSSASSISQAIAFVEQSTDDPLLFDRELYLENDLLRKLDMNTMANSIEGRVPLLSPELISASDAFREQFTERKDAMLKPLLKKLLCEYIPEELVYRKKSGFGFDPSGYLQRNQEVADDLDEALGYFQSEHNLLMQVSSKEIAGRGGLSLAVLMGYFSIKNTSNIMTTPPYRHAHSFSSQKQS